jgi:hypothetical protein
MRSVERHVVIGALTGIGFALTLGGALLVGSLLRVWQEEHGFRSDGVLALALQHRPEPTAASPEERRRQARLQLDDLLDRLRDLPGVDGAGAVQDFVLSGALLSKPFHFRRGRPGARRWGDDWNSRRPVAGLRPRDACWMKSS